MLNNLTPKEIVKELDRYIIGQDKAKKSVAIALRNRYRRMQLDEEIRDEIIPKNIIMIGPTGVGKTEIARRLAKIVKAPFVKVEATKFTEVGYVGKDVESMIRDLVEVSINIIKEDRILEVEDKANILAEERILAILVPSKKRKNINNPLEQFFNPNHKLEEEDSAEKRLASREIEEKRAIYRQKLKRMELEDDIIEIEIEENNSSMGDMFSNMGMDEVGMNVNDMFSSIMPKKMKKKKVKVKKAREIFKEIEGQNLIDMDEVHQEALKKAEESGIIFLDEIDKIAGGEKSNGPDVSRGGVQRDILPIVEGSTVKTKYGNIKTDHILFIAAGAFHISKPSDLIPELQGRFPVRVELDNLSKDDFVKILTKTKNSLLKQYELLLATEKLDLSFTEDAILEIAEIAYSVNEQNKNIGARRLHTILEKLLEDISFEANEYPEEQVVIDKEYVNEKLKDIVKDQDLSQYIL